MFRKILREKGFFIIKNPFADKTEQKQEIFLQRLLKELFGAAFVAVLAVG
jgi:hypothetical protein